MDAHITYLDNAQLLLVCEQLNLMILAADENLVIREATPAFASFIGHPLIGSTLIEMMPLLSGVEEELRRIARGQSGAWRIPGFQLSESHTQQCDVLFTARRNQPGLVIAARRMDAELAVEQMLRQERNEVTLLKGQLENQAAILRTAKDRLENLDRERRTLSNLIVQDIKSSLAVIAGYTEWLQSLPEQADMAQQRAFQDMMASAQEMNKLVNDVQTMERIEQQLAEMAWSATPICQLVEVAVSMWQGIAGMAGVKLTLEIKEKEVEVEGDRDLLVEALYDILESAIRGTPRRAQVDLQVYAWDRWMIIRSKETFAGATEAIPAKQKENPDLITESQPLVKHSAGLALALVRLIAEGHGGHLSVEEHEGLGQTVSLWLLVHRERHSQDLYISPEGIDATAKPADTDEDPPIPPASNLLIVGEGAIRINVSSKRVWINDESVMLTANEYRLLHFLAIHADQVMSHNQILDTVWSYEEDVSLDTLRVLIWRLRKKIESGDKHLQYLRTVRGFGYVLVS